MNLPLISDKTYTKIDYTQTMLPKAEFDNCAFINCIFTDTYLSSFSFLECEFIDCNLSNVKAKESSFKNVRFTNCKMIGFPFFECNPFLLEIHFNNCNLSFASFYLLNIKHTIFNSCKLESVDFTETNLMKAIFNDCDLSKSTFEKSNLEKADFTTATNYTIHPEHNKLKGAKFSKDGISGLLSMYNIHIE